MKDVHYYHNRVDFPFVKQYTLAGVVDEETLEIRVGVSVCKEDNFNKKVGRELAVKAALEKPIAILHPEGDYTLKPFLNFAHNVIPQAAVATKFYIDLVVK